MTCDCDFCSMTRPDFCGPTIWQQLAGLGLSAIAGLLLLAWLVILPALGVIWIASRV